MKTVLKTSILVFSLLILMPAMLISQKKNQISEEAKAIIKELMADKICPGVAIGVVSEDGAEIYCIGNTAMSGGIAINEATVFRLGSATKGFTGILLADQVIRKKISLSDPVEKYLPSTVTLPERNGKKIRFIDLVTHSSGLPVRPSDYKVMENAPYSVSQLYAFLPSMNLSREIGTKFSYSSLGAGLTGHIISLIENKPFGEVLKEKIFDPLGMNSTDIILTEDMKRRVSRGHDQREEAKWLDIPEVFASSGSINTTVGDMVKFISAGLGITQSPINNAFNRSRQWLRSFEVEDEERLGMAMFWMRVELDGYTFIGHSGDTFGFSAYVGFNEKNKTGVVVLSNGKMGVEEIGFHILSGGEYLLTKENVLRVYYEE